jgi:hypothetical protein
MLTIRFTNPNEQAGSEESDQGNTPCFEEEADWLSGSDKAGQRDLHNRLLRR